MLVLVYLRVHQKMFMTFYMENEINMSLYHSLPVFRMSVREADNKLACNEVGKDFSDRCANQSPVVHSP